MDYTEEDIKKFEKEYNTVVAMRGQMSFIPDCKNRKQGGGHRFITRTKGGIEYSLCLHCPLALADTASPEVKEEEAVKCPNRFTGEHIFIHIEKPGLDFSVCRYCTKIRA